MICYHQTSVSSSRSPGLVIDVGSNSRFRNCKAVCRPMSIAEVIAISDLLGRAKDFAAQLQDGWYKRSPELDLFQEQVSILSERQLECSDQFRRHGLSDERLLHGVKVVVECLNKQQRYVEKLQKSRILRWKMSKAFPSELSNALNEVLEAVDADPQLLTLRIGTTDLRERCRVQKPAPLPFRSDQNYVPISGSILAVQKALENVEGPRVVNLYGEPGLGKSCLVKYVALRYEEQNKHWMDSSACRELIFPDGVHYLLCGQGAKEKIKQLQQDLLENLGFEVGSAPQPTDTKAARLEKCGNCSRPSYHMKLRCRLAERKLLIVLDDLWEVEVMKELFVNAKGVKYLVTSQIKDIWISAEKIELKRPTKTEARHILANHTEGLPQKGQFPDNVRAMTDAIIQKLHRNPLSLANVGISIISSRASDPGHWKMIEDDLQLYIDEISVYNTRPLLYDNPYSLTVGASMMLMVKGLRQEVLPLLDLISLFNGPCFPQELVKFFYRRISRFNSQYAVQMQYLESRLLIELWEQHCEFMVSINDLRTHYIREMRNLDMRALAVDVLGGSHDGQVRSMEKEDQDLLTVILAAMEFAEPFLNEVAANLEQRVRINNGGEIPRTMGNPSFLRIARTIRRHREFRKLYNFLNHDVQDGWRQQAHQYTKKIILKFFCQGKLDDHSMAGLLQIPETTSIACCVLRRVWHRLQSSVPFSSAHGETLYTLVALLHNNSAKSMQRANSIEALSEVIALENDDTILSFADIWKTLLVLDGQPAVQIASIYFVEGLVGEIVTEHRGISALWEILVKLLVYGKDNQVQIAAGRAIRRGLSSSSHVRTRIACIPNVFRQLSNLLESEGTITEIRLLAGELLCKLSRLTDDMMALHDSLEGIKKILANVIDVSWSLDNEALRRGRVFYQAMLGNYEEALSIVNGILVDNGLNILDLRNRAVLKMFCGDLQGAVHDLNVALQLISESSRKKLIFPGFGDEMPCCFCKSFILKHRGYAKYLMEDYVGAKEDGEVAIHSQLSHDRVIINPRLSYQMVEKLSFLCLGELGQLSREKLGSEPKKLSSNFIPSLSFSYRRSTFIYVSNRLFSSDAPS